MNIKKFFTIKNIKKNIDDGSSGYKNFYFDIFFIILILISSSIFIINTYSIGSKYSSIFIFLDYLLMTIFTVEVFIRNFLINKKFKDFFSIYNIIDFVAIIPFWFVHESTLQFLRVFRILKIFKFLQNYIDKKYLTKHKNNQIIFFRAFSILFILLFVTSSLIYFFEKGTNSEINNFSDALYLALVTVTTVGFGDVVAETLNGRIVVMLSILFGIFSIPIYIGLLMKSYIQGGNKKNIKCEKCGAIRHEYNATHCKMCGGVIYQKFEG